jgi:hypothetical protein
MVTFINRKFLISRRFCKFSNQLLPETLAFIKTQFPEVLAGAEGLPDGSAAAGGTLKKTD